jgi:hypothetical protein
MMICIVILVISNPSTTKHLSGKFRYSEQMGAQKPIVVIAERALRGEEIMNDSFARPSHRLAQWMPWTMDGKIGLPGTYSSP